MVHCFPWHMPLSMQRMMTIGSGSPVYFAVSFKCMPGYLLLAFVPDRQKGLLKAIECIFPGSAHGYCLRHLYENLYKQFKQRAQLLKKNTTMRLSRCTVSTQPLLTGCWSMRHRSIGVSITSHHRYGHITSNIAESLNAFRSVRKANHPDVGTNSPSTNGTVFCTSSNGPKYRRDPCLERRQGY